MITVSFRTFYLLPEGTVYHIAIGYFNRSKKLNQRSNNRSVVSEWGGKQCAIIERVVREG